MVRRKTLSIRSNSMMRFWISNPEAKTLNPQLENSFLELITQKSRKWFRLVRLWEIMIFLASANSTKLGLRITIHQSKAKKQGKQQSRRAVHQNQFLAQSKNKWKVTWVKSFNRRIRMRNRQRPIVQSTTSHRTPSSSRLRGCSRLLLISEIWLSSRLLLGIHFIQLEIYITIRDLEPITLKSRKAKSF